MRTVRIAALALVAVAACTAEDTAPDATAAPAGPPVVVFETTIGPIVAELAPESAPETVRHFLKHVRSSFYDGVIFHRVEPGFVIQAGGYQPDLRQRKTSAYPVANENPTGMLNARGTIAMARTTDPHGGLVDFFFNLVDNPKLDFRDSTVEGWGYVAFGTVVEGIDVIDSIARIPTERRTRILRTFPVAPVTITRAYIQDSSATP
jgi:cyclophilin family peptidyl-prolyl cis-trans isomerase